MFLGTNEFLFCVANRDVLKLDELGLEIAGIALPAALALTADPIASLVDTAFIGQIGMTCCAIVVLIMVILELVFDTYL